MFADWSKLIRGWMQYPFLGIALKMPLDSSRKMNFGKSIVYVLIVASVEGEEPKDFPEHIFAGFGCCLCCHGGSFPDCFSGENNM